MFSWKPIYAEIATKLLEFESRNGELVQLMKRMQDAGLKVSRTADKIDESGTEGLLAEIDPITFFGNFNRGITDTNRTAILNALKLEWDLSAPLPEDYCGLPVLSLQQSWLMPWGYHRPPDHVPTLWRFYRHCLSLRDYRQLDTELFDACCALKYVGLPSLTMGMFWSNPDMWIAADSKNRAAAESYGVTLFPTDAAEYLQWLESVKEATTLSGAEFSHEAHLKTLQVAEVSHSDTFAAPFDHLFDGDEHANRVLDQFAGVLQTLEATEADDRLACAVRTTGDSSARMSVIYGNWVVFRYERKRGKATYEILLADDSPLLSGLDVTFKYKNAIEGEFYVLARLDASRLEEQHENYTAGMAEALGAAKLYFAGWESTPFAGSHTYGLIELALEERCRHEILRNGLDVTEHGIDYWLFSPGEGAQFWSDWKELGIGSIGWDEVGNLDQYQSKESIAKEVSELYPDHGTKSVTSMLWDVSRELKPGDVVFAKKGLYKVCGWGIVSGEYRYDDQRELHQHTIPIDWRCSDEQPVPTGVQLPIKTLTRITTKRTLLQDLGSHYTGIPGLDRHPPAVASVLQSRNARESYTKEQALEDLFLPESKVDQIIRLLRRKKNVVLQGAPGTGKTFVARRLAYLLLGEKDESRVPLVQFHQSTTYEDFIQGYRPGGDGGFELKNGNFFDFVRRAQANPNMDYVFIIDEINRGNLSKVFGELMMLIESDKRSPDFAVPLTYSTESEDTFFVPPNLYLIGTMNTADRSLSLVDYALRRRFGFVELDPGFDSPVFEDVLVAKGASPSLVGEIRERMNRLNKLIVEDSVNLGRGYQIGHSFFVPVDAHVPDADWMGEIMHFEVLPLLEEYWCDDTSKLSQATEIALGMA